MSIVVAKKKGSERNQLENMEKFCARIGISKEDFCDLDLGES
jgi:hypothetical protein